MTDFWDACRYTNQYLAIIAATGVGYRLTMMLLDRTRRHDMPSRHRAAWFAWIALSLMVAAAGASYYNASETPANWTSAARSVLNVLAILLTAWWPHPRRLPVQGAS